MCNYDEAPLALFTQDGVRKARKIHKCNDCKNSIQINEEYYFVTWLDTDEEKWIYEKTCLKCHLSYMCSDLDV